MKIRNEILKEIARRSYPDYVDYVHEGRWIRSKHLLFVCNKIQEFIEKDTGHAFDILILQMPPQHGKSMSTTETLPSWYLGKYPENRVIQASYNEETAERFCRRNKEKIKQFGKDLFNVEISNIDRSTEFELTNNVGRMISRGIMSGITSNPANLIIIDDPIKNRLEADSETFRERLWEEWQNTIKTRLSANAKVIVIMTRWHEDDLAGRIIANEKNVEIINLPCEAEDNDPLGRNKGQALFPEIGKDDKWLQEFKQGYMTAEGSRAWLALFQGHPTNEQGNIIKRAWIKYWDKMPDCRYNVISVDATFKDGEKNDFVAIQEWGKINTEYYLKKKIKSHLDFVGTIDAIDKMYAECRPNALLIEDKANGSAIIQVLRRKYSNVIAVNPEGGKEARASAVSPLFESGSVYVLKDEEYVNELITFPYAKHDDETDATTQALNHLRNINANVLNLTPEQLELQKQRQDQIRNFTGNVVSRSFIKFNG